MLQIVIPMAGAGSRFARAGFVDPKPLIRVQGKPMIQVVVENLRPQEPHSFVFICQSDHVREYGLSELFAEIAPGAKIVTVDGVTRGAAETVLAAKSVIDMESPLMVANSDQYVDINIDDYLLEANSSQTDGFIMTMWADDPKWSYVSLDKNGFVEEIREKQVISNSATVGIYNFGEARFFFDNAEKMIDEGNMSNGEYYVAPVYEYLIGDGMKVGTYQIASGSQGMFGLGTPEDLEIFLSSSIKI